MARKAGAIVSFDVNYRPGLWDNEPHAKAEIMSALSLADVVKVNETELALLSGTDEPDPGCRRSPGTGLRSAWPPSDPGEARGPPQNLRDVPGFTVEAVDATGCGDAFMAALLVRLLPHRVGLAKGLDARHAEEILRWANAAGALTARKKGVMNALPDSREVDALAGRA